MVAIVVTIVVLLILAGITIVYVFGDNGVFDKAQEAREKTAIAKAREKLEIVLGTDATVAKHTNPIYNQEDFLDDLILEKIKNSEIMGDVAIIDRYAFSIDRSVPKIGEYIGKKENLVFPTLEASVQLAEDNKSATITITVLEEKNGINKIEIWQKGEKLDEFPYEDIKTTITKEYVVNQNGSYTIKAYGNLVANKKVEVAGILTSVKFEPNGNAEYKKSHSTVVTIEKTEDKIVKAKYQWTNSASAPEDGEFPDDQTLQSGDTITKTEITGKYYLWVMLETQSGEKVKWRSEEFCFDNRGPNITSFTTEKYSETAITLSATAKDTESGTVKFEFYIDGVRMDSYTQTLTATTGSVTKTATITGLTTGSHDCEVRVYDEQNNSNSDTLSGSTKLYAWEKWSCNCPNKYKEKITTVYEDHEVPITIHEGYTKYTFNAEKGTFEISDWNTNSGPKIIYERVSSRSIRKIRYHVINSGSSYHYEDKILIEAVENPNASYSKGSTNYGIVRSISESAYPNEGQQDGYWYIKTVDQ